MKTRIVVPVLAICLCLASGGCLPSCVPPPPPDLTGSVECPAQTSPGEEIGDGTQVILNNIGATPAEDFSVELVLSSDTTVPDGWAPDSPNYTEDLSMAQEYVDLLVPTQPLTLSLDTSKKIPDDTPVGDYYLGLVVDPGKTVKEIKEENNVDLCPMQVCAPLSDVTSCQIIEASGGTVGFARLRLRWTYGTGEKPDHLLITVYRFQAGEWDNIMPGEEPFEVPSPATTTVTDVTIYRLFLGDYRIVFTAHYSCDRENDFTFDIELEGSE